MSYQDVVSMPLKAFWAMNTQIVRVAAEFDLRALRVAAASQGESAKTMHEHLAEEQGQVVIQSEVDPRTIDRDEHGIFELKNFMKSQGG